jgi:sulfur-carrier protein
MGTGTGGDAGDEIVQTPGPSAPQEPTRPITVRYWASARAAAGVETDDLPVTEALTLTDVVRRAAALHPGTRLPGVLEACSVLIGDQPVKSRAPDDVLVRPGQVVEFLPPFAGGA